MRKYCSQDAMSTCETLQLSRGCGLLASSPAASAYSRSHGLETVGDQHDPNSQVKQGSQGGVYPFCGYSVPSSRSTTAKLGVCVAHPPQFHLQARLISHRRLELVYPVGRCQYSAAHHFLAAILI